MPEGTTENTKDTEFFFDDEESNDQVNRMLAPLGLPSSVLSVFSVVHTMAALFNFYPWDSPA